MASSSESAIIASEICSATGVGDLGVDEYCWMRRLRSSRSISSGSGIGTVVVVVVLSVLWLIFSFALASDTPRFDTTVFVVTGFVPLVIGWGVYWVRRK